MNAYPGMQMKTEGEDVSNTDIVHVRRAKKIGPYRLRIWFTDGTAGEWDFTALRNGRGPMVEPFKDPAYFDRVFIEFGDLTWPNGYVRRRSTPT